MVGGGGGGWEGGERRTVEYSLCRQETNGVDKRSKDVTRIQLQKT